MRRISPCYRAIDHVFKTRYMFNSLSISDQFLAIVDISKLEDVFSGTNFSGRYIIETAIHSNWRTFTYRRNKNKEVVSLKDRSVHDANVYILYININYLTEML